MSVGLFLGRTFLLRALMLLRDRASRWEWSSGLRS